jgi:hypothetical protein
MIATQSQSEFKVTSGLMMGVVVKFALDRLCTFLNGEIL